MAVTSLSLATLFICVIALVPATGLVLVLALVYALWISQTASVPKCRPKHSPTHLLIVLGSGGHTAEMLSMLRRLDLDPTTYTFRTYVVSSGDQFSATRAMEFEQALADQCRPSSQCGGNSRPSYDIVTVPRARRVHQSYLTAPLSTLQCMWVCFLVLRGQHRDQRARPSVSGAGPYPDLILTNGPATAVCVIAVAKLLRFYLCCRSWVLPGQAAGSASAYNYQLRTIFVESWARVTTLSLSGRLLLPVVDRFLVQWPSLAEKQAWKGMRKTEYVGMIVD